jgi:hypothetical protein
MPIKTVGSYWPDATTLFDYVSRAMPYTASSLIPRLIIRRGNLETATGFFSIPATCLR